MPCIAWATLPSVENLIRATSVRSLAFKIKRVTLHCDVAPRKEIKWYNLWSFWIVTFFGQNCHFVQNLLIIFDVIFASKFAILFQIKPGPQNLRMGKPLKMIEGIIVTVSFWS